MFSDARSPGFTLQESGDSRRNINRIVFGPKKGILMEYRDI